MPIASIPSHIDRGCPPPKDKASGSGNQKADWKRVFAGAGSGKDKKFVFCRNTLIDNSVEMERIRKPNYAIAQPTDLRKLLTVRPGGQMVLMARNMICQLSETNPRCNGACNNGSSSSMPT